VTTKKKEKSRLIGPSFLFYNSFTSFIYSLGVALWTSADYLLDEEEEPALSAEFCDFIGLMTEDEPANRPPLKTLLPYVEKYKDISAPILTALLREVDRKKSAAYGNAGNDNAKAEEFGQTTYTRG